MKLLLFTDAWFPQVNGVVRTLNMVTQALERAGDSVEIISPADFKTFPCPTYPEIRLAIGAGGAIKRRLQRGDFDGVHIATEGPIGYAARRACVRQNIHFTTAYHTKFPEYVNARAPIPLSWLYKAIGWFHRPSDGVMVATPTLRDELAANGFTNLKQWSRGVELSLFKPYPKTVLPALNDLKRPLLTYVGRVAVEKNIGAFLDIEHDGTKMVVGDGPMLASLQKAYPDVVFVGAKSGEELAQHYAASDVFVFPSKTDTFGLVMLEALASGVPVAAYRVPGPLDVVGPNGNGVLGHFDKPIGALRDDLKDAIDLALKAAPDDCRAYANNFSWDQCAALFRENLVDAQHGNSLGPNAEAMAAQ